MTDVIIKPLNCFQIQSGKFKDVIFFFKDVIAKRIGGVNSDEYTVSFSYDIMGGNYKDSGYKDEQEHLNSKVNENTKDLFLDELGKILHPLVTNNDQRIFVQWVD